MFKLARTFRNPGSPQSANRGFPAPGDGAQSAAGYSGATTRPPSDKEGHRPPQGSYAPTYPVQGFDSWDNPAYPCDAQRGFPEPYDAGQVRDPAWGPGPPTSGRPVDVLAPWWNGHVADRTVHNFGKVLTNPIGAGVVARYRPQPSYGPSAQYVNGTIFWTSQAIPTSVRLQGLTNPAALAAILGPINVQAAVRTTG